MKLLKIAKKIAFGQLNARPDGDFAYHITYLRNVPSIAKNGLLANSVTSLGKGGHLEYSRDKIFLTEESGIPFWFQRMEEHAENDFDDILTAKAIPVVLRFAWPNQIEWDERGSEDNVHGDSFYTPNTIDVNNIEIFNNSWVPVSQWVAINPKLALDEEGYFLSPSPFQP